MSETDLNPVSVTQGDRVLTGIGADPDRLAETMERHAPDEPAAASSTPIFAESAEPKPTRGQKRFSELTSERDKEKTRAEAAERERDDLKQRLEASSRQPAVEPAKTPEPAPKAKFPFTFDSYLAAHPDEDYDDFVTAKAVWTIQQQTGLSSTQDLDTAVRERIDADRTSRTQADRITQEVERGRKAYPDFDAVIKTAAHMQSGWSQPFVDAVMALDNAEHIRYALAKDAVLSATIKAMDPISAGIALSKLIPSSAVVSPASAAAFTPPPVPHTPVGGGAKPTVASSSELAKKGYDFDSSGYREKRAAERGVKVRR